MRIISIQRGGEYANKDLQALALVLSRMRPLTATTVFSATKGNFFQRKDEVLKDHLEMKKTDHQHNEQNQKSRKRASITYLNRETLCPPNSQSLDNTSNSTK